MSPLEPRAYAQRRVSGAVYEPSGSQPVQLRLGMVKTMASCAMNARPD
jgi:hypothetical protein